MYESAFYSALCYVQNVTCCGTRTRKKAEIFQFLVMPVRKESYVHSYLLLFESLNCCWSSGLIHPHIEWQMLFLPKNTFLLSAFLFQCSLLAWFKGMKWTQECVCVACLLRFLRKNSIQITKESVWKKTTSYELHVSRKEMFVVSVFTDDKNQLRTCCCSLHDDFPFTLQISICTQKYHVQTLFYEFYKFGMGYLRTPTFHLKLQCIKTPFFSAT